MNTNTKEMNNIFNEIKTEREYQDKRFGADRDLHPFVWNAILTEEVGEVAKECLDFVKEDNVTDDLAIARMREELIQVAAVAVAWIECLDKYYIKNDETIFS